MIDNINNLIIVEKKKLRKKSKDFIKNFKKIEKYIEKEVTEIENLKNSSNSIIPEIAFNQLNKNNDEKIKEINKRGCVIVRNVFDKKNVDELNKNLEEYIEKNNFFEDEKKNEVLDKYFSNLKSNNPQICALYWSKTQIELRHSKEMATVKKWLNNLWIYKHDGIEIFDPNKELIYADRV